METKTALLNEFLETVDDLSPEELERVEKRVASAREKKNGSAPALAAPSVMRDLFAISFNEYLAMPLEKRHAIQILAYEKYSKWIEQELERHQARWILVCGGKVIESSPTLRDYPRREKVRLVGEQYGLMPFVFVKGPMIEESIWAILPHNDSYPTLPITVAAENENPSNQDVDDAHTDSHLERRYRFHILPLLVGVMTETDKLITGVIDVFCVRDWAKSSLCLVNRTRQALIGRNLLYELPLRIALDGRKQTTEILGQ